MWNCGMTNPCGPSQVMPAYNECGGNKNGSTFVLIVVLFILLIIVGACYI